MSVRRFLVTASLGDRMDVWAATAAYANWIDGRGPEERQTWLVTCLGEHGDHFLAAAKGRPDVTVEEIQGAGDDERYELLAGKPGSGWTGSYADQAAEFIAGVEQHAALRLPVLPDDPAAAAVMRAIGYDVRAEVLEVDGPVAIVRVLSEDEEVQHAVRADDLAYALGAAVDELPGTMFLAVLQETPETGPVLSGCRPESAGPVGEEVIVACLLLFGDQAELAREGGEMGDTARWPASAIVEATGLELAGLPGKRFAARMAERDGRVLFWGFRAVPSDATPGVTPRSPR
ncbi:MAG: hypothetical protein ACRDPY_26775 [Streptosporangiaceae bacterium]